MGPFLRQFSSSKASKKSSAPQLPHPARPPRQWGVCCWANSGCNYSEALCAVDLHPGGIPCTDGKLVSVPLHFFASCHSLRFFELHLPFRLNSSMHRWGRMFSSSLSPHRPLIFFFQTSNLGQDIVYWNSHVSNTTLLQATFPECC